MKRPMKEITYGDAISHDFYKEMRCFESITYFPFDAVVDSDGNYDRTYTSEQFALYFSKLFSNGVYGVDSHRPARLTALNGNMYITVAAVRFSINGRFYAKMRTENILITAGDVYYGRI